MLDPETQCNDKEYWSLGYPIIATDLESGFLKKGVAKEVWLKGLFLPAELRLPLCIILLRAGAKLHRASGTVEYVSEYVEE